MGNLKGERVAINETIREVGRSEGALPRGVGEVHSCSNDEWGRDNGNAVINGRSVGVPGTAPSIVT